MQDQTAFFAKDAYAAEAGIELITCLLYTSDAADE